MRRDPKKLREWRRRSKGLKRSNLNGPGGLTRSGPLPARNPERVARRIEAGEVYGPYHRACATLPCVNAGHPLHDPSPNISGHHVVPVGRGGKDEGNELPACDNCHTLGPNAFHRLVSRERIRAVWGYDPVEKAAELAPVIRERVRYLDEGLAW